MFNFWTGLVTGLLIFPTGFTIYSLTALAYLTLRGKLDPKDFAGPPYWMQP